MEILEIVTSPLLRKPRLVVGQIHIRFSKSFPLNRQDPVVPFAQRAAKDFREVTNVASRHVLSAQTQEMVSYPISQSQTCDLILILNRAPIPPLVLRSQALPNPSPSHVSREDNEESHGQHQANSAQFGALESSEMCLWWNTATSDMDSLEAADSCKQRNQRYNWRQFENLKI